MPVANVGRGLKAVARREFERKVARMANPVKFASFPVVNGKVNGVPIAVLEAAVVANRNHFTCDGERFFVNRGR